MNDPLNRPLRLVRGDDADPFLVRWTDSAGAPIAIATAALQIRRQRDAANPAPLTLTGGAGLTITGNEVAVHFTAAQTALLPDHGFWDLEVVAVGTGLRRTLAGGPFVLQKDVTRV